MKVEVKIILDGTDITQDLSPYLLAATIEDNLDEADKLEVRLADKDKLFMGEWFPPRGATIEVTLTKDDETFDAGIFEIDEVEFISPRRSAALKPCLSRKTADCGKLTNQRVGKMCCCRK